MKKKLFALLLAGILLCCAVCAYAVSWGAVASSAGNSPFSVEVIKLGVRTDAKGAPYYIESKDLAAYPQSTVYYAIKLTLPSYMDANAYYKRSDLEMGSYITVSISYTNIKGKTTENVRVRLTREKQVLWYDGFAFAQSWTAGLNNTCGCADPFILRGTVAAKGETSITACVGAWGKLENVRIGDDYTVSEKTFYGARPCPQCKPADMKGYKIESECSANGVFFTIDASNKVTGIYAYERGCATTQTYLGGMVKITQALFGWRMSGVYDVCGPNCVHAKYELTQLDERDYSVIKTDGTYLNTMPNDGYFAQFCEDFKVREELRDWNKVYFVDTDGEYKLYTMLDSTIYYRKDTPSSLTETTAQDGYYKYLDPKGMGMNYGNIYYKENPAEDVTLFRMLSADAVDCDTTDRSFLNTINKLLPLLGFTYAEVSAGSIYMNNSMFLSNFGLSSGECGSAVWPAYSASITVSPVIEVPATGSGAFTGLLALAGAGLLFAVRTRKRAGE